MAKYVKKKRKKIGTAPGTLIHTGDYNGSDIKIELIEYNKEELITAKEVSIEECFKNKDKDSVKWVNIQGLHQIDIIERIGKEFGLHPLMLEDILNTSQRPKLDDYDDYLFVVLRMLYYDENKYEVTMEQISLVLVDNYVISFQEFPGDTFNNLKERIKIGKGSLRKSGPDYLLYALVDSIVDSYFTVLEQIGDDTEEIEQKLMEDPSKQVLKDIYRLKREMISLNNSVWPLRELVNGLIRIESPLINKSTIVYIRDVYDHIIQVIDIIESYRDMISGMLDTYLSSISNKTNDVMKVLTIFSTIFIPLSFLAGIYGMNFKNMPELELNWGYSAFWLLTAAIVLLMLRYFRKKKWL